MFRRNIQWELNKWKLKNDRKPLVLRGARQVGKTTAINQFAEKFEQYIYINLELPEERKPFEDFTTIEKLVQTIFFLKNKSHSKAVSTLIFIDEIQEVPAALNILRYFYEQAPEIHVIAAGSLLETLFNKDVSFPVGRVGFMVLRPVSFPEFLDALNESSSLEQLNKIPFPSFAFKKLIALYHTYALIGGMPEVIAGYIKNRDLTELKSTYESLIVSYSDDVEKYATSTRQVEYIRHAMRASFSLAGGRIKYEGFGSSNYGSREMGEALRTLEKAMLLQLIFPVTDFKLPLLPNKKKSARLQVLDTGMLNYFIGVQKEIIGTDDLNKVYQGTIIEHLTGQELLAFQYNALSTLNFWVREKKTSTAEVDFIFPYEGKLIPVEVKSGSEGKLKSLHIFMNNVSHEMAIRFYAGELHISIVNTPEKKTYYLLNLPYFLVSKIEDYIKWFEGEITKMKSAAE
jgi:predicted AAA+ superfamily ATPase